MRSDTIKKGFERAPHRSLLKAAGVTDADMGKPFIAVCNSFVEIVPGHVHLNRVGRYVKECVREAGGVAFEFNTIGVDDGIAMGHRGMLYSLPSREIIADSVETMLKAHCFDGMICIPNCDKIVPGMLMGAMRCNIPTVFVSGGPMKAGKTRDGRTIDLISVFEGVAAHQLGKLSDEGLKELEDHGCPTCGCCSGMFTANSMNCLCEALGMSLPGSGSVLAVDTKRDEFYRAAAFRLMELIRKDIKPRDIATLAAFDNALALDMAMGGSTNTILHVLAVAHEAGVPFDLARIDAISRKTPTLCKVSPSSQYHMEDVDRAGGIPAILAELLKVPGLMKPDCITVTGKTLAENLAGAGTKDPAVIRPLGNAYSKEGALAVLYGNLAPEGGVVKTAAVDPKMLVFEGPAVIFESQDEACDGDPRGEGEGGRLRRHPVRGAEGRPGDAGDAGSDLLHHGGGARRQGGDGHRRALLRRDARCGHRSRLPRGGRGRADRPGAPGGPDPAGHPGAEARPARSRGGTRRTALEMAAPAEGETGRLPREIRRDGYQRQHRRGPQVVTRRERS